MSIEEASGSVDLGAAGVGGTAGKPAVASAARSDTKARILEVAARLFAERGYSGTAIRDISEELGVTKAALYYHFASKDEILHAIVDQPIAAMRSVIDQDYPVDTPEGRRAYVRDVISAMSSCSTEVVAVFKDPALQARVGEEVETSGIVQQLALDLAMGLSGVTHPEQIDPAKMVRAVAAVSAGQAMIDNWHLIYPECERFSEDDLTLIANVVLGTLEG